MMIPRTAIIFALFTAGCAAPRQYQGYQVGRDYYAHLDSKQKEVFDAGAEYATNDMVQREYDVERRAMRHDLPGARQTTQLNKKIVPVSVDSYTGPDGVEHDAGYKFIELNSVQ
jgi:hypothetical protein